MPCSMRKSPCMAILAAHKRDDPPANCTAHSLETWASKDSTGAADAQLAKTAVITWRGMLTKLLLAVYEADNLNNGKRADGWDMNAMLVDVSPPLEMSKPGGPADSDQN